MNKTLRLTVAAALVCTAPSLYSQNLPGYLPQDGIQGWWPFNGNALDETGNGYDGTVSGAQLTTDRFEEADRAYSFNGLGDHIDLGNHFNNLQAFTFTGWIKRGATGMQYDEIFTKEACFSIAVDNGNGKMHINFGDGIGWSPAHLALSSESVIPLNEWIHIAVTRSWPDGETLLYVNGVLENTGSYPVSGSNDFPVMIGGKFAGLNPWFNGAIDDIGLWNTALDRFQVYAVYEALASNIAEQTSVGISAFPNPCVDVLHLVVPVHLAGTLMRVFDHTGRCVEHIQIMGDRMQLNVSHYAQGQYLLSIEGAPELARRFVVVR